MSPRKAWPLAIAALLAGNVLAMIALALAAHVARPQVLPGYAKPAPHAVGAR